MERGVWACWSDDPNVQKAELADRECYHSGHARCTELNLKIDPPIVVIRHCKAAVKRWRWQHAEKAIPQLATGGTGRGVIMEPIWQLLAEKNTAEWGATAEGFVEVGI